MSPADLRGALTGTPLPEILKRVRGERRSGTLRIIGPDEEIHFVVHEGELRDVSSTAPGHLFGDALCRSGLVSRAAVDAALEALGGAGQGYLALQLQRMGLVTRVDIDFEAQKHFIELARTALSWERGEFLFEESAEEAGSDAGTLPSAAEILVAAIRQLPKSERFVELLGDGERFPSALPSTIEQSEALSLEPAEAYVLSLCDGATPARLILQLVPSRLGAARTLCALELGGLIEFLDTPRAIPHEDVAAQSSFAPPDAPPPADETPKSEWSGDLRDETLPEVLKRIFDERKSGTLKVAHPSEEIHLFFESGELRTAISTAEGRRLGETLRRRGIINEVDLAVALQTLRSEGHGRLGKHLLKNGMISPEVLAKETQRHFEEIVLSAFSWSEGRFDFESSGGRLDPDVSIPLSTADVLMLGVRQVAESERFVALLGNLDRFASAVPTSVEHYEAVRLEPGEAYVLSLCDGKTTLRSILKVAPSRLSAARTLYALWISGLAAFADDPTRTVLPDPPPAPLQSEVWSGTAPPDPEVRAQLARGNYLESKRLLERKDYYGAIVLLQESVRLAPDNSEYHYRLAGALARNASWRARAGNHYSRALVLDPVRQELMREYAEFLADGGKFREAQVIARRLAQRYPDEPRNQELLKRCEESVAAQPDADNEPEPGDERIAKRSILSRIWTRRSS